MIAMSRAVTWVRVKIGPGPILALAVGLLAMGWPGATSAAVPSDASPTLVEAGFITKFPLFVTWPEHVWRPGVGVLTIGVLGDSPVLADLQQLAPYAEIEGSTVAVRYLVDVAEARECEIVFIAATEADRLDDILACVRGLPVLTVADSPGFAQRGVHINFYLEEARVRFELNQRACEEAGLGLSFRLRNVARMVE